MSHSKIPSPVVLKPVSPHRSYARYDSPSRVLPLKHTVARVKSGLGRDVDVSDVQREPAGWSAQQHPEGIVYHTSLIHGLTVLTEADINLHGLQPFLDLCTAQAVSLLEKQDMKLSDALELVLFPDVEGECEYYLADHVAKKVFWLEEVDTDMLLLETYVESERHLQLGLEALYWFHVHQFPSHSNPNIRLDIDKLREVLLQMKADVITSPTTSIEFTSEELQQRLDVLDACRGSLNEGTTTLKWIAGRLWNRVYYYRFMIHYGERTPRLDVSQRITQAEENFSAFSRTLYGVLSFMMFRLPASYSTQLSDQFCDSVAYRKMWTPFVGMVCKDWWMSMILASLVFFAELLFMHAQPGTSFLAAICLLLSQGTVVSGAILLYTFGREDWLLDNATDFLSSSQTTDHQYYGLLFSLPRSFLLWSVIMFSSQELLWLFGFENTVVAAGLISSGYAFATLVRIVCGSHSLGGRIFLPERSSVESSPV
ncbi:hypothetical protein EIP91_006032 [Steccherinum ochraceum]|uniref:Uncharacterized protein n=1 Tax=Steccherinum ochraceum TaxID=92696 RepID=A0A4R0R8X7_9APHY|nr:hypothetical protein EIP91_006032 [Steccherinum ochraceum]